MHSFGSSNKFAVFSVVSFVFAVDPCELPRQFLKIGSISRKVEIPLDSSEGSYVCNFFGKFDKAI